MLADQPYLAGDPELVADRHRTRQLCDRLNAAGNAEQAARDGVLTDLLRSIGAGT
jgi:maltose O-acetyltransferase